MLFVATLVRLGLRNRWTWIVTGWLAAPIAWSLAIGQAQVAVTFLVALGSPWAIALAANLKILPVIVAVYWIGRRDWRAVGVLVGWLIGLALLQFVLEPAGTIAFSASRTSARSATSRTARSTRSRRSCGASSSSGSWRSRCASRRGRAGWALAVSASVLVSPRLLMYQLSTLQAAVRSPDDPDVGPT